MFIPVGASGTETGVVDGDPSGEASVAGVDPSGETVPASDVVVLGGFSLSAATTPG